ncbi:MAG: efflux transporter periplasmic adaptor subunit [Herminiimonas sp.]|nr:efflux transporter periplasmic adaptor subunit [Herminiimonas sp.]
MHSNKTPRRATFVAATLAIIGLVGCGPTKQAAPAPQTPEVAVVTVHRANVPVTIELPGRTSPYLMAQVRARVDGIVQKRTFQEGADVKANQPLYQIDPAPYRAALDSAEATLQKMEANLATTTAQLERYKVLIGGNAVSKQAYDNTVAAQRQAAADVAASKAAVSTARINLGYTNVVSPIAGRSSTSQVTQGAYVQGGAATLLTTVQQIDPIYVDLRQSSAEGLRLRRDMASGQLKLDGPNQAKVGLTLEDGSQYPLAGTLQFSGITVDPATGSVIMRALFPNPKNVLLPGMFVRARLEQGVNENALKVPVPAVAHNPQGQSTVLVVGPDNKLAQRTVQAKSIVGDSWVVDAGLNDGEQVVVSGGQKVQPGTLVKVVQAQSPGAPVAKSDAAAKTVVASEAK